MRSGHLSRRRYNQGQNPAKPHIRNMAPTDEPSRDQAGQEEEHWPTTDELIAQAHANREGEIYPTPERLLVNLPVVLRGLCDHVLTGEATTYDVGYALASIIDAIENV